MKVWVNTEEYYPVYFLDEKKSNPFAYEVEIPEELYKSYKEAIGKFNEEWDKMREFLEN